MPTAEQPLPGWSAADVEDYELADQPWIDASVRPMKRYNPVRHQAAAVKERAKRGAQKLRRR